MNLTNESYIITLKTKNATERYLKDEKGWLKVSAKGNEFRMSPEQVLNHILPVLAGVKQNLTLEVTHRDSQIEK